MIPTTMATTTAASHDTPTDGISDEEQPQLQLQLLSGESGASDNNHGRNHRPNDFLSRVFHGGRNSSSTPTGGWQPVPQQPRTEPLPLSHTNDVLSFDGYVQVDRDTGLWYGGVYLLNKSGEDQQDQDDNNASTLLTQSQVTALTTKWNTVRLPAIRHGGNPQLWHGLCTWSRVIPFLSTCIVLGLAVGKWIGCLMYGTYTVSGEAYVFDECHHATMWGWFALAALAAIALGYHAWASGTEARARQEAMQECLKEFICVINGNIATSASNTTGEHPNGADPGSTGDELQQFCSNYRLVLCPVASTSSIFPLSDYVFFVRRVQQDSGPSVRLNFINSNPRRITSIERQLRADWQDSGGRTVGIVKIDRSLMTTLEHLPLAAEWSGAVNNDGDGAPLYGNGWFASASTLTRLTRLKLWADRIILLLLAVYVAAAWWGLGKVMAMRFNMLWSPLLAAVYVWVVYRLFRVIILRLVSAKMVNFGYLVKEELFSMAKDHWQQEQQSGNDGGSSSIFSALEFDVIFAGFMGFEANVIRISRVHATSTSPTQVVLSRLGPDTRSRYGTPHLGQPIRLWDLFHIPRTVKAKIMAPITATPRTLRILQAVMAQGQLTAQQQQRQLDAAAEAANGDLNQRGETEDDIAPVTADLQ